MNAEYSGNWLNGLQRIPKERVIFQIYFKKMSKFCLNHFNSRKVCQFKIPKTCYNYEHF